MASVDELAGPLAGWGALLVASYLLIGFGAAVLDQRGAVAGRCAERVLLLYPRFARAALRATAVAVLGLSATAPVTPASASEPAGSGSPRPPVVAPARADVEPLDWPAPRTGTPHDVSAALPPSAAPRVTVEPGDCLWTVAARALGPGAGARQVADAWPRWWAANRDLIGADPDLLRPGLRLRVPTFTERSAS